MVIADTSDINFHYRQFCDHKPFALHTKIPHPHTFTIQYNSSNNNTNLSVLFSYYFFFFFLFFRSFHYRLLWVSSIFYYVCTHGVLYTVYTYIRIYKRLYQIIPFFFVFHYFIFSFLSLLRLSMCLLLWIPIARVCNSSPSFCIHY